MDQLHNDRPQGDSAVIRRVLVVGTGLIGTSVGLALRDAGVEVALEDIDTDHLHTAVKMGAGTAQGFGEPADVAVFAVPPDQVRTVVAGHRGWARCGDERHALPNRGGHRIGVFRRRPPDGRW
jgi:2-polyprenyl-6-methoxyphenol hydroxylase-like FAD-dependent oxidoreductase